MKKSLVMCGLAALALASCTQNEVLDVNESRAIGFDGFIGKPTRQATTNENLTTFQVFGGYDNSYTNVYDDVAVNRTGDAESYKWATDVPKYWTAGKTYNFYAYAPASANAEPSASGVTITDFVADGETDLILSNKEEVITNSEFMQSPTPVGFTFNHILSMIKFTFSTDLQDVNIAISELKVNAVPNKATYNGSAWDTPASGVTKEYTLDVTGNVTSSAAKSSSEAIVIPQSFTTGLNVTFKVKVTGALDIEKTHTVTLPTTAWAAGNRYNYTAKLTYENIDPDNPLKPIEFDTPKEEPWVDQEGGDVTFPGKQP